MAWCQLLLCYGLALGLTSCNEFYNDDVGINQSQDDVKCANHIHKFYRQMKCQPELSSQSECPVSYKCPSLEGRKVDHCYYDGHEYPLGYYLTQNETKFYTPCIQSCQCVSKYDGAVFDCSRGASQECKEEPGCQYLNNLDDHPCCKTGVLSCKKGDVTNVTCEYEGRTYKEGERFFPTNDFTCSYCVCASGFNGTIAKPYCHQSTCVPELRKQFPVELSIGCIPIYLSEDGCCPISFRCPWPNDTVVKSEKKSPSITDKTCRFGNLTLEVGDRLSTWTAPKHEDAECSCQVPPLASCVVKNFVPDEEFRQSWARKGLDTNKVETVTVPAGAHG